LERLGEKWWKSLIIIDRDNQSSFSLIITMRRGCYREYPILCRGVWKCEKLTWH
jgi:hypothetical protein